MGVFTGDEQAMISGLSPCQGRILRKIASLVGDEQAGSIVRIPADAFLGAGHDERDIERISRELSAMSAVVREFRFSSGMLEFGFAPGGRGLLRKLGLEIATRQNAGFGEACCDAALALKRRLGATSPVTYILDQEDIEFDWGEDVSCLRRGFARGKAWIMRFDEYRGPVRAVTRILPEGLLVAIQQAFDFQDGTVVRFGYKTPAMDFVNPDAWDAWMSVIANKYRDFLAKVDGMEKGKR